MWQKNKPAAELKDCLFHSIPCSSESLKATAGFFSRKNMFVDWSYALKFRYLPMCSFADRFIK